MSSWGRFRDRFPKQMLDAVLSSSRRAEKFGMVLSRLKISSSSSLSAACLECKLTRYCIPPLLCWKMHREILMDIWIFFFAAVGKNISRKFLEGIYFYNNIILVQACVYSESCRQCVIMSLAFIYIKSTK